MVFPKMLHLCISTNLWHAPWHVCCNLAKITLASQNETKTLVGGDANENAQCGADSFSHRQDKQTAFRKNCLRAIKMVASLVPQNFETADVDAIFI